MKLDELGSGRVALLGLGREGRSFCRVWRGRFADRELPVFAEHEPEDRLPGIDMRVGPLDADLRDFDVLVRSPGIPVDHPGLEAARTSGTRIITASSIWLAERVDCPLVVVTGSKGKSTTAALLADMVREDGQDVVLAGNIGAPLLDFLDTTADWVVAELSSYQLADLEGQIPLAVVTRLFPEHQDWHGGEQAYYDAKMRVLDLARAGRVIVNADDPVLHRRTRGRAGVVDGNRPEGLHGRIEGLFEGSQCRVVAGDCRLRGRHNFSNAALAMEAGRVMGLGEVAMIRAIRSFRGLPHRLESLGVRGGIEWINDSISTSPESTRAALECLAGRPVTLIAGGQDRGSDWAGVFSGPGQPHAVIALPDNAGSIVRAAREAGPMPGGIHESPGLAEAVDRARTITPDAGLVLFSPGAPSYNCYRDFEARGMDFAARLGNAGSVGNE